MSSSSSSSSKLPLLCDKELGKLLREWNVKQDTPSSTSRTTPIPKDLDQRLEKLVDGLPILRARDTNEGESVAHLRVVIESLIQRVIQHDCNNSAKYQKLIHKINPPPLPQQQLQPVVPSAGARAQSSNQHHHELDTGRDLSLADYEARYARLDYAERCCLGVFSMLPEGFAINKTEIFYLSRRLSIISKPEPKLKDDNLLSKLATEGLLTRINTSTSNCFSSYYMMQSSVLNTWVRQKENIHMYTTDAKHGLHFLHGSGPISVININNKFLNSDTTFNIIQEKARKFWPVVLHLGSWRRNRQSADYSNNYHIHNRDDYIVVDVECLHKTFLNLNRLVWWLSLRGTSGIVHLPESVSSFCYLEFLDLSACNNLETLPKGIGLLRCLEYLDLSECYLLDYIPKDITSLHFLKVLKGFIINSDPHLLPSSSRRRWSKKPVAPTSSSSCQFSELTHLKYLEKLTIRTTRMDFPTNEDLHTLRSLRYLHILGITWVGNPNRAQIDGKLQEFPNTVTKLELQSAPLQTTSQLLELIGEQKRRSHLNKLYIRGGWFQKFSPEKHCFPTVKIVRLRYLPILEAKWDQFRVSFPNLTCLEVFQCPNLSSFPCDSNGIWQK